MTSEVTPRRRRQFSRLHGLGGLAFIVLGVIAWNGQPHPDATSRAPSQRNRFSVIAVDEGPNPLSQVRFDVANIFPGATVARRLDLNANTGPVTLTTGAVRPSLLTTDTTNGLHLRIDACEDTTGSGWTQRRDSTGGGYACAGTVDTVLSYRPIIQRDAALSNIDTSATTHLLVSVTLPDSANNAFQGLATTLQLTFTDPP